ncbi:hypothetical protein B0O99DRAFT_614989 [Bisporella sp. PMI_857]|nr:hypothetical protein B0O99DRAFT_614989 [Bisporella sp. PMI_857]
MTTRNICNMSATMKGPNNALELLYHVKATMIDFPNDSSGATRTTDILGTYVDLAAAKTAACSALLNQGYKEDDFVSYEIKNNSNSEEWTHGDGVMAFAKTPSGYEFEVCIDTKPNSLGLKGNAKGRVEAPLHYVLQTLIDYNKDATGGVQNTEIEGTYLTRKGAFEAAQTALLDGEVTKKSFAEYVDRNDQAEKDSWPYGEDVWVHAVAESGENFNVSVKAQPHSHPMHKPKDDNGIGNRGPNRQSLGV